MAKKQSVFAKLAIAAGMIGAVASPEVQAQAPTESVPLAPVQTQPDKQATIIKQTRKNRKQRRVDVGGGKWDPKLRDQVRLNGRGTHSTGPGSDGWLWRMAQRRKKAKDRKAWLAAYAAKSAAGLTYPKNCPGYPWAKVA